MSRDVLSARRRELNALLMRLDTDDAAVRADRSDATADDEHDPEGSTLSGEWQRIDALRRSVLDERAEVDAALARVDAATYGICVVCGNVIAPGRLEARPMATTCIACAA
ncbi:TraR/DksA C4-type zinc finger protein [Microbacterium laevaniformans]|jgi:DnaK suppressor protein|uniref:Molecular chaperone DnaK n=1 Tax=Microbacterium laevaniformans TaxID=36807 RepID=A0A4V3RJJ5_9MICO|nr:TraR/DksA C4-type zinc finger protein [Microbacterium laevaniformans]EIC06438.1 DnaK suppressor protein [Microbacterium laevaniformans OR221]MBM7751304.1 RNA polymerase-binding transcription factor DksA [Microbacterium laevaniformans]TGY36160.1 molecular chaperone DnaK [Microbacterium laevaniformans]GLJ63467.1 DnaK suppressor protein [Microbacterium laevaniformans]